MTEIDALKRARSLFGPEAWVGHLQSGLMAVGYWEFELPQRLIIRGSGRGWNQAFKDARRRTGAPGTNRPMEALFLERVNAPGGTRASPPDTASSTSG